MNYYDRLKTKLKDIWHWIVRELKDWHTFVLFLLVCMTMYLPVFLGYGAHALFKIPAGSVVATGYIVFWAGPFTPFFPICLAITLFIKRIIERIVNKDKD